MNWTVNYFKALDAWDRAYRPTEAQRTLVLLWVASVESYGPSDNSVPVEGDLYVYTIRPARVRAEFLAISHDRNLIVRRFLPSSDAT